MIKMIAIIIFYIIVTILAMLVLDAILNMLNEFRIELLSIFYNTKIGYYFEKYGLFFKSFCVVVSSLVLYGFLKMTKQMIEYIILN